MEVNGNKGPCFALLGLLGFKSLRCHEVFCVLLTRQSACCRGSEVPSFGRASSAFVNSVPFFGNGLSVEWWNLSIISSGR